MSESRNEKKKNVCKRMKEMQMKMEEKCERNNERIKLISS